MSDTIVEYDSNNSGGHWWLTDQNWLDLEKAGWKVAWRSTDPRYHTPGGYVCSTDRDGRWLGALASTAERHGLSLNDAIDEWEAVTGRSSAETGCDSCGDPHWFSVVDR
jgi:hypothetical protein